MAKIIAPNKQYSGISASVVFVNGIGETDKPELLEWFRGHGYAVEDETPQGEGVEREAEVEQEAEPVKEPDKQGKKGGK